jgi:hypothetical protein
MLMGVFTSSAAAIAEPKTTDAFQPNVLPVRALMLNGLTPVSLDSMLSFIRDDLPHEGVNTLIFQIDYNYQYQTHPELIADHAFSKEQIKSLVHACRAAGIKLIPLLNCLGHQSWAKVTHKLLTVYPEYDETPGLHPENKDLYCRSYCPNHPDVHRVVFDLLGELAAVFETDAIHVGMDEVFLIGESTCPRCKGADKAELFAQEVRTLHDFLAGHHVRLWMWGDRFIDGHTTGFGEWEASMNNTHRAIDLVPKDIVVCDWHYDAALPTPTYFAQKGFDVVICSWNKPEVGVAETENMFRARAENRANKLGPRLLGVMVTNWSKPDRFFDAYRAAKAGSPNPDFPVIDNLRQTFARVRELSQAKPLASGK